jgi:protein required for attachment to host cells
LTAINAILVQSGVLERAAWEADVHPDPTWIVVVDDHAARFFLRSRWGEPLAEVPELAESADFIDRRLERRRGAMTPADGRTGHESDPDEIETAFLNRVAKEIDDAMTDYSAQGLVLCAPPRELSLLRDCLSDRSRAKLSCEITRDLVGEKASSIDAVMRYLKA